MKQYRISVVSYTNSKPFMLGLKRSEYLQKNAVITTDNPAECAAKVISGESDMGLIPVAVLPDLGDYHIYSDYCIGAKGKVKSVYLFSNVPVHDIRTIIADPQSRTSVMLTKVLAKFSWMIDPRWENAESNGTEYLEKVSGNTAAVMIGDRTFNLAHKFKYAYDLADEWMTFTGLPFVFACWAGKKSIDPDFIKHFNTALEYGLEHCEEVIREEAERFKPFDIREYLTNNITFVLDSSKRKGLDLFLSLIQKLP